MKVTVKALVAAVVLSTAGVANAAIDLGPGLKGVNSDLFMSAWDPVKKVSYTRDLGIHFEDFLTSGQFSNHSWSGNPNTLFGSTFANSNMSDVHWNVAAVNQLNDLSNPTNLSTYGILTTSNDPQSQIQSTTQANLSAIDSAVMIGTHYAASVNSLAHTTDPTVHISTNSTGGPNYAGDPGIWNNNWGGVMGFLNDAGVGQKLAFYQVALNSSFDTGLVNKLAGSFQLSSNGTLAFTTDVTPVPLPPAVWLLGSALVGLVGIGRRKREKTNEALMA